MNGAESGIIRRAWRFFHKPFAEQSRSAYARWRGAFPSIPFPVRLPFGAWFIARGDYLGSTLTFDGFEPAERAFVRRFLKPGMTVLDVGAHQGLYSLLSSKAVGNRGRVFAFEPSPRERTALRFNLRLNFCKNVRAQAVALGESESDADLYVAEGLQSGLNSLRPSKHVGRATSVRVHIARLEDWLRSTGVERVDFIKLDVEGGELAVLRGAGALLVRRPRPVILAELEDSRSGAWGHQARDTAAFLMGFGFRWFAACPDGSLLRLPYDQGRYEGNFVAVPEERLSEVTEQEENGNCS